jgi:tetratricopeptide (TPR) repeat protein
VLQQAVDKLAQAIGKNHLNFPKAKTSLGRTHFANGNVEAAESTLSESLEIKRQLLPDENATTVWTWINLGQVLTLQDRFEEAETVLMEAVEKASAALLQDHWQSIRTRLELAICQLLPLPVNKISMQIYRFREMHQISL